MAEPTRLRQANAVLGPPAGMTEEECGSLPVHVAAEPRRYISRWQPSADDLERLVRGEPIWIHVFGEAYPPIAVSTEDPFA